MRTAAVSMLVMLMGLASDVRAQSGEPSYERIRAGLERAQTSPARRAFVLDAPIADSPESARRASSAPAPRRTRPQSGGRDSVWNGALIGAGIGAAGGFVWAHNICGPNDPECLAITRPVGLIGGAGIGAAIGALVDALHK